VILSNEGIKAALKQGAIAITPEPEEDHYQTSSVDLTLADDFRVWDETSLNVEGAKVELDLTKLTFSRIAKGFLRRATTDSDGSLVIPPYRVKQWVFLAQTRAEIFLSPEHQIAARVEGRSSLARFGLLVHLTAPIIHCGFRGHITLEVVNLGPFHLRLTPATTKICQLVFEKLESAPSKPLTTSFQGQRTPAGEAIAPKIE
jgi:dCTP deaminase